MKTHEPKKKTKKPRARARRPHARVAMAEYVITRLMAMPLDDRSVSAAEGLAILRERWPGAGYNSWSAVRSHLARNWEGPDGERFTPAPRLKAHGAAPAESRHYITSDSAMISRQVLPLCRSIVGHIGLTSKSAPLLVSALDADDKLTGRFLTEAQDLATKFLTSFGKLADASASLTEFDATVERIRAGAGGEES